MLLRECINVYKAFQLLCENPLPLKSSWMLAQNISKLKPIVESFDEARQKYIDVLRDKATLDEQGQPQVSDELAEDFRQNVEALLDEKQTVRLKKVTLIDDGNLRVEPNVLLAALDYLIIKEDGNKAS